MQFAESVMTGAFNRLGRVRTLLGLLACLGLTSVWAGAQETDFHDSVSVSAFGLLGLAQATYEHMVADQYGLVAEASSAFAGPNVGTWTIGASLRYHLEPQLGGAFLNTFWRYGSWLAEVKSVPTVTLLNLVGVGAGYRWQWPNGVTATLRLGYGLPVAYLLGAQALGDPTLGLDIEPSVGFSF